jgi:DNA primase
MRYDSEMLKKIDDSVDLYDYVVGQGIELQKRGGAYFTNCTLHVDKTPSLAIYKEDNFFYCFSCKQHGRIINWLRAYEKLSFPNAVDKAAKLAAVDISTMCQSDTINFLKVYKNLLLRPSVSIKHDTIPKSEYDKYSKEPIKIWEDEGIQQSVMDLFGVRIDSNNNRIVYPVFDLDGNLINIKGRTMYSNYKELGLQKYINYFKIGKMDYFQGLNVTIKYVKQCGEIIIFESIKSVMKAYQWGYKNAASAEKHTLTEEQINLLIRLRVDIVFAYDCDVDCYEDPVLRNIKKLSKVTNVYIISDYKKLLGGVDTKNAPVDCGKEIWEELYVNRRRFNG